jgi:hypothetical protein
LGPLRARVRRASEERHRAKLGVGDFHVSIRLRDGSATKFHAYPIQSDKKIFVGSTYSVKSEALSDLYATGKDVAAFSISMDGKWRAYRSMPAYEGLVFEDDCIGDVGKMLASESGLERRQKLLEMMSVGCTRSTEGPYAVFIVPSETRSFGPTAAKRVFVKVHLSNIDLEPSTMTGWIEKDAIGSHQFAEVKIYSSSKAETK